MTPARLAGRVAKALEGQFAKPVNIAALARSMREWELPIEMLTTMVEVFLDSPRHYLKADETPWVGFIRQRTVLLADAQKYLDSADPSAAFRADADDDEYDPGAEFRAG